MNDADMADLTIPIWHALALLPGILGVLDLGSFPSALECAEAADYFGVVYGVAVACFQAVAA